MTMKDLARLANVSVSTVSKAFCDADDVSRETKEHIFAIAKENGCYGKYYKGKYHKKIIAIIVHEISSNYYTTFVNELQRLIENAGGMCVISTDDFNKTKQAELIEYYVSYLGVDGILVLGLDQKLKKGYDVPIVALFASTDAFVDTVNIDVTTAICDAVRVLHEYGHRKIAFLSEKLTRGRENAYKKAMLEAKNSNIITVESNERFEKAGIEGVNMLLEKCTDFTAVVCAYDYIAIGAIKQLKKSGYRVPEDVSVVGIDNISSGKYTETSLSSIDSHPSEVCRTAFDLLQKKLKNPYFRAKQKILIQSQFIIRESIAKREEKADFK